MEPTLQAELTKLHDNIKGWKAEQDNRLLNIEQKLTAPNGGSDLGPASGEKADIDTISGMPILTKSHKLIDNLPHGFERKGLDVGKFLRGIVTGNWREAEAEKKSLSEGSNAAGGYLLAPEISAQWIDIARARQACIAAGARTIPLITSQQRIPVLNTDCVAAWKAELATVATAAPDLAAVTATAHTLAAYIPNVSVELFEDAPLVGEIISSAFARNMAVQLDAAALTSNDANGPTGMLFNSSVHQTSVSGGALTWDEMSKGVEAVRDRNYEPNAYILSPDGAGELARQKASTAGSYLGPPEDCAKLGRFVTTSALTDVFIGDFTRLIFFPRTDLTLEVSRVGDGTAWSKLAVSIRAYLRADVIATEPRAFEILTAYTS